MHPTTLHIYHTYCTHTQTIHYTPHTTYLTHTHFIHIHIYIHTTLTHHVETIHYIPYTSHTPHTQLTHTHTHTYTHHTPYTHCTRHTHTRHITQPHTHTHHTLKYHMCPYTAPGWGSTCVQRPVPFWNTGQLVTVPHPIHLRCANPHSGKWTQSAGLDAKVLEGLDAASRSTRAVWCEHGILPFSNKMASSLPIAVLGLDMDCAPREPGLPRPSHDRVQALTAHRKTGPWRRDELLGQGKWLHSESC